MNSSNDDPFQETNNQIKANRENLRQQLKNKLAITSQSSFTLIKKDEEKIKPPLPMEDFEEKYTLHETVGQGAHAIVKRATKNKNGKEYAVKIFRTSDPEIVNMIRKTYYNTKLLDHEYIVKAYELYINEQTETQFFVMQYCDWPSLEHLINHMHKLSEVTATILYCHEKGICHRDIKPDNILVNTLTQSLQLKLVDFGVSKRFMLAKDLPENKPIEMWTVTGSLYYCAPEIFQGGGYNQQIDIWSVGVILFQMLTGHLPFQSDTISDTIEQITQNNEWFEKESIQKLSSKAKDFLKRLLTVDAGKRLTAEEALQHPWLNIQYEINHTLDDSDVSANRRHPHHYTVQLSPSKESHSKRTSKSPVKTEPSHKPSKKDIDDFKEDPINQVDDVHVHKKHDGKTIQIFKIGSMVMIEEELKQFEMQKESSLKLVQ